MILASCLIHPRMAIYSQAHMSASENLGLVHAVNLGHFQWDINYSFYIS